MPHIGFLEVSPRLLLKENEVTEFTLVLASLQPLSQQKLLSLDVIRAQGIACLQDDRNQILL